MTLPVLGQCEGCGEDHSLLVGRHERGGRVLLVCLDCDRELNGSSLEQAVRVGHDDSNTIPADGAAPWQPIRLRDAASGGVPVQPVHGRGLVYGATAITVVSSEPGIGKSMYLAAVLADEAIAGRVSLYLDFERTPGMLLERLEAAGLSNEQLDHVLYLRPAVQADPAEIRRMVEETAPVLVALDAYDAALAAFDLETKNEDIRAFHTAVIEPLRSAGAALVIADHVPKDREKRGRYSIGGQAKLALADAHLGLSAITPLRRGAGGKLRVRVLKDTYGWLPQAAVFELRSHEATGALSWQVSIEGTTESPDGGAFRPTTLMERVSRALEIAGEAVSRSQLERDVKGKVAYIRQAIDALAREGFAEEVPGPRGARLVELVRPFREADE